MLFKISGKIVDDQYTGEEMEDFYPDNTFYLHVEVENQVKCHVQLPAEDVGDEDGSSTESSTVSSNLLEGYEPGSDEDDLYNDNLLASSDKEENVSVDCVTLAD